MRLRDFFVFDDFAHFIRNYLAVVDLVKTAEDVRLLTYEVAAELAQQHGPLRRTDGDAVHLGHRGTSDRGLRGGDRGRPARGPA